MIRGVVGRGGDRESQLFPVMFEKVNGVCVWSLDFFCVRCQLAGMVGKYHMVKFE